MSSEGAGRAGEAPRWFELDDFDEARATEADQWFLDLLREHAVTDGWRCAPEQTLAFFAGGMDYRGLRVVLSLNDYDSRHHLMEYGVVFDGSRILGDRVHSQTHDFDTATAARFEDEGAVPYLAAVTAMWFESLLDMPIEHRVWYSFDQVDYEDWVIVTTGEVIGSIAPRRPGRAGPPDAPPDRVTLISGTVPEPGPRAPSS